MQITILETERLFINEAQLSEAPFYLELVNSPGWLEHIGDRQIKDLKDAEEHIHKMRARYTEFGFGFYTMIRKEDGVLLVRWD